ncbi:MAG: ATP synthase F1 subunit epsilon [candidate division KSB1 bacterium]|nr:ATP synthase F1 subunit epsilon [candidate division KSB1 bacterium]MDZ7345884.1 ATP synthase F1 subunit epsilon [candidate division KSB1 bacterium]
MARLKKRYFQVEIITPDHPAIKHQAVQVIAPGKGGLFGVLINHAPAIFALEIGLLKVEAIGGDKYYTISGGAAYITNNVMKIVTDSAEDIETLDVERAKRARDRALERLKSRQENIDQVRAKAALARALNRLRAVQLLE